MSMEDAIFDFAGAVRELSAAIKEMNAGRTNALTLPTPLGGTLAAQAAAVAASPVAAQAVAATAEKETEKARAAAMKLDGEKNQATLNAELEQAVSKVEDDAKKLTPTADTATAQAGSTETATSGDAAAPSDDDSVSGEPLDYVKDVRPVLLAAIKKAGKEVVAAMIGKFGVDKADKLTPEQLPAVLIEAQKLAA